MAFDRVAHDYGSPGRVFKIDENGITERLIALENLTNGQIQWTEQAGLRQVTLKSNTDKSIDSLKKKLLALAYSKD
jgi:trehalose-6-phosphate synthase